MRRICPITNMDNITLEHLKKAEAKYWEIRESLLASCPGQWVAVSADGLVARGDNPLDVTFDAAKNGPVKTYINRVGFEDSSDFKVRRISFSYDTAYSPFPLPRARVQISNTEKSRSKEITNIIPDTGADITCLPVEDCLELELLSSGYHLHTSKSFGAEPKQAILVNGYVGIDGKQYRSLIEIVRNEDERVLGRDVLNQLKVIFDGKNSEVTFE